MTLSPEKPVFARVCERTAQELDRQLVYFKELEPIPYGSDRLIESVLLMMYISSAHQEVRFCERSCSESARTKNWDLAQFNQEFRRIFPVPNR